MTAGRPGQQYVDLGARPKIPLKTTTQSSDIVASHDSDSGTDYDSDRDDSESLSDDSPCHSDIDDSVKPNQTDIDQSESVRRIHNIKTQ